MGSFVVRRLLQMVLDVPPLLATTMFLAFFVVLLNAVVDILYAYLDPRMRLQ